MPGIIPNLQFHNLPGKILTHISDHVSQSVRNKIWSYNHVDLGALLDNNNNPEDEEEYDLFPDKPNNHISFQPSNKHVGITSFSAWNCVFCVLIKIMAIKWPHLCLPMVQYSHIIWSKQGNAYFPKFMGTTNISAAN